MPEPIQCPICLGTSGYDATFEFDRLNYDNQLDVYEAAGDPRACCEACLHESIVEHGLPAIVNELVTETT